jgi:hypothetical protein
LQFYSRPTSEVEEVFILAYNNWLILEGIFADCGVFGFSQTDVQDVLAIHSLLAEKDRQAGWKLVIH